VEDEGIVALDLATRLARMGYQVIGQAASSAQALSLAQADPPDVVLMDIVISGDRDGIETAQLLQQRFDVAVIYITAYGDDRALQRAKDTRPYGYLLKPIREQELRCAIEIALHRRRLDRELATALERSRGAETSARAINAELDRSVSERTAEVLIANRRLGERTLELQQAMNAKDAFLARVSHELRTPLSSILGFTDILLMGIHGPLNADQTRHLATIQRSGEHLLSLINDLLDLSKIGSGRLELHTESLHCRMIIEEVCAALAPLATAKGLELRKLIPEQDLCVHADERALRQILLNLVGNAIKFTEAGSVSVGYLATDDTGAPCVAFEVRDTGPGLCREDWDKLFQPFSQLEGESAAAVRGSGLGLHVSLGLAEQMQGTIRVTGEYGVGSTFRLILPVASVDSSHERVAPDPQRPQPGAADHNP
jgi:signal transduction histidine kinase